MLSEVEPGVGRRVGIDGRPDTPDPSEVGVADRGDRPEETPDEVGVGRGVRQSADAVPDESCQPIGEDRVVAEDPRAVDRRRPVEVGRGPGRRRREVTVREVPIVADVAQPAGVHAHGRAVGPSETEGAVVVDLGREQGLRSRQVGRLEHRLADRRFEAVAGGVLGQPECVGIEGRTVRPGEGDEAVMHAGRRQRSPCMIDEVGRQRCIQAGGPRSTLSGWCVVARPIE